MLIFWLTQIVSRYAGQLGNPDKWITIFSLSVNPDCLAGVLFWLDTIAGEF